LLSSVDLFSKLVYKQLFYSGIASDRLAKGSYRQKESNVHYTLFLLIFVVNCA